MLYIILLLLIIMAIQDFKTGEVSNFLFLPFFLYLKVSLILVIIFLVCLLVFNKIALYIGGADLKLIILFLGIFQLNEVLGWLVLSLGLALTYALILQKREIRMMPFFLMGYSSILII